jgi:hypothetical protein
MAAFEHHQSSAKHQHMAPLSAFIRALWLRALVLLFIVHACPFITFTVQSKNFSWDQVMESVSDARDRKSGQTTDAEISRS